MMENKTIHAMCEEEVENLEHGDIVYDEHGNEVVIDDVYCDGDLDCVVAQDVNGDHYLVGDLYLGSKEETTMMENKSPYIAEVKANITYDHLASAIVCLICNGIDEDEAGAVLRAIGYTLLDTELFPDDMSDEILEETIEEHKHIALGDE